MGPFSDAENQKMVEMIRAAQPHMLFVGFGAPKQDTWIDQYQAACGVPVAVGVGGVFNFIIGRVRRAPEWMQKSGMEWLYRVAQEPRRLWRRYFVQDMPVLARIAADAFQVRVNALTASFGFETLAEVPRGSVPTGALPGYPLDPPQ
jgi:N-acetylglucosaminyldiphosphoundecaprenol N-acetyl-beta-D-mannosaminyltransferase